MLIVCLIVSLIMGRNMIDFKIMLIWLDDIRVVGGDDCLEYVMLGILKGNGI